MYNSSEIITELSRIIDVDMFESAVVSNPIKKGEEFGSKLKITRISLKGNVCFQFSEFVGKKVIHKNYTPEELIEKLISKMEENYKQCAITANKFATVLMNKKRLFSLTGVKDNLNVCCVAKEHNKTKNYILQEGEYADWMYHLGLMDKDGKVASHMQKKFRQINKFVEILQSVEKDLPENATIVDFGCGKSYLTFAMYHYFNNIKHKNVTIRGYDLKADVVKHCNELAEKFNFGGLKFYAEDIANVSSENANIDMIITLHACDTATDYAIYHGIRCGCKIIMNVPCCQHELNAQMKNDDMSVILNYGILKERFASILTDSIRARILELKGYKVDVLEFIDMEHTPKNIMLRSVKKNNYKLNNSDFEDLKRIIGEYNIEPTLYKLIFE
jgi:SAM-dependent methyltransferase